MEKNGHSQAVKAFNEGIIDRFIRKDDPELLPSLMAQIDGLNYQFFCERTASLLAHIESNTSFALSDPLFIEFFNAWRLRNEVQEYYLMSKQGSLLALTKANKKIYLLVHTDNSLDAFLDLYKEAPGMEFFLNSIKKRKKIPFFGIGKELWPFKLDDWNGHFYEATLLQGRENYYWAEKKSLLYVA